MVAGGNWGNLGTTAVEYVGGLAIKAYQAGVAQYLHRGLVNLPDLFAIHSLIGVMD